MAEYNIFTPLIDSAKDLVLLGIEHYNKVPEKAEFNPDAKAYFGDIIIPIGVKSKRKKQYLRIGGEQSHTYIVGQTGSGKSNLVKVILTTLTNNYPTVKLWLFDYKRVELSLFKNTRNCEVFEWSEEGISEGIKNLFQLVLDRYEELEEQGLTEAPLTMNPIVCTIEEISLMPKQDMKILRKIMAISRAVHVYVIFTTQRPSTEVLDNVVKSLTGNRICLKTDDEKNSIISLDRPGCETLRGKGHGFMKSGGIISEFQAYHIDDVVVKDIVSKHNKSPSELLVQKQNNNDNTEWVDRL
jgi:S-DNA-T family DNA segregation ATPase FtsK/SpoIIIE